MAIVAQTPATHTLAHANHVLTPNTHTLALAGRMLTVC